MKRQRGAAPPLPPAGLVCEPPVEGGRYQCEEKGACLWAESAAARQRLRSPVADY